MTTEQRSFERIKYHYEIEKNLAEKLKNSTKEERLYLYSEVYNELYEKVTDISQLTQKASLENTKKAVQNKMEFLKRFLSSKQTVVEIGPGDCSFSFKIAEFVDKVYGLEISKIISDNSSHPDNFELIIYDGCNIPFEDESVDIVYSNQLMEHIHPDDALMQLQSIQRILVKGGKYICVTPNKVNGPWDISKYFDQVATGLHLKEYSVKELNKIFKETGFSQITTYVGAKGIYLMVPVKLLVLIEDILSLLPYKARIKIGRLPFIRQLLNIRIVGIK